MTLRVEAGASIFAGSEPRPRTLYPTSGPCILSYVSLSLLSGPVNHNQRLCGYYLPYRNHAPCRAVPFSTHNFCIGSHNFDSLSPWPRCSAFPLQSVEKISQLNPLYGQSEPTLLRFLRLESIPSRFTTRCWNEPETKTTAYAIRKRCAVQSTPMTAILICPWTEVL